MAEARGGGDSQVAAMMRGDVAVPEEDRRRRPWQEKEKEKEKRKDAERRVSRLGDIGSIYLKSIYLYSDIFYTIS